MRYFAVWILACVVSYNSVAGGEPLGIAEVDDVYPFIPNWRGLTVLHIGDSHVSAGLTAGLSRRFQEAGAAYFPICWEGSHAKSWVISGKLKKLLGERHPDVVVVTLGTNIMTRIEPGKYAGWIRALVERLKGTTCYWLGPPPLLDDERGFNEMIEANAKPCRYFDSRSLDIPQRSDGKFHLTKAQGQLWADRVWLWINGAKQPSGNADAF